jgi:predicted membrane protein
VTTAFVFGFVVGGFVFWNVSAAVERFRRARWDFNATRRGLRSLIEMMWARGVQAVKGVLLAALVIVVVVLVWRGQDFR